MDLSEALRDCRIVYLLQERDMVLRMNRQIRGKGCSGEYISLKRVTLVPNTKVEVMDNLALRFDRRHAHEPPIITSPYIHSRSKFVRVRQGQNTQTHYGGPR